MEARCLMNYIYYSYEKIGRLWRQLPESRRVALKDSTNTNLHADFGQQPAAAKNDKACISLSRLGQSMTKSHYREFLFDPNDMYQFNQVVKSLRKAGQITKTPQPGKYYEFRGNFHIVDDPTHPAPEGYSWLVDEKQHLWMLVHNKSFVGDNPLSAMQEYFQCCKNGTLALCGLALVLCIEETGTEKKIRLIPLILAISSS